MSRASRLSLMVLVFIVGTLAFPPLASAQQGFAELCPLFRQQQQVELEDLEVEIQAYETELAVAEEIFALLDDMWQSDLVERLPWLGGKNRRDATAVNLERAMARRDRQQAVVDQYRLACPASSDQQAASEERGDVSEAHDRYLEADCRLRELDVRAHEIALLYDEELLQSALDLRQSDIAARQTVLFSERDVALTRQQLDLARQRVARCRR